jgi:hypothetical protein
MYPAAVVASSPASARSTFRLFLARQPQPGLDLIQLAQTEIEHCLREVSRAASSDAPCPLLQPVSLRLHGAERTMKVFRLRELRSGIPDDLADPVHLGGIPQIRVELGQLEHDLQSVLQSEGNRLAIGADRLFQELIREHCYFLFLCHDNLLKWRRRTCLRPRGLPLVPYNTESAHHDGLSIQPVCRTIPLPS